MKSNFIILFSIFFLGYVQAQINFVAPPDLVVSCQFDIKPEYLNDYARKELGDMVFDSALRSKIIVRDIVCAASCMPDKISGYPGPTAGNPSTRSAPNLSCNYYHQLFDSLHPEKLLDLVYGFSGFVSGVQRAEIKVEVIDKRQCGKGRIYRNFSLIQNNAILKTVTQTIWVVSCNPFSEKDIEWPAKNYVIRNCNKQDSIQKPRVSSLAPVPACSLISIEYKDDTKPGDSSICLRIARTYTIIDWCQYDPFLYPGSGKWEYVQNIDVIDDVKPELNIQSLNCVENANTISAITTFNIEMNDFCSVRDFLVAEYYIDINNDNKGKFNGFDLHVGPSTKREQTLGGIPVSTFNPYALDSTDVFKPDGRYPVGKHKLHYRVTDGCGNVQFRDLVFEVLPSEPPSLTCLNNLTIVMPSNGQLILFAKDFVDQVRDNCSTNFSYSFDPIVIKPTQIVNCGEFEKLGFPLQIRKKLTLYVKDEAENSSSCELNILINDNKQVCKNQSNNISGQFYTLNKTPIHEVSVTVKGNTGTIRTASTACTNFYNLLSNQIEYPYNLIVEKKGRNRIGIDIWDVILIRNEILYKPHLSDEAKLASDVNYSGNITAADISEIKKFILSEIKDYSKKSAFAWNFIGDSLNRTLTNIFQDNLNITGFRYGDIDGSSLSMCNQAEIYNTPCFELQFNDQNLEEGKKYKIGISSKVKDLISGMQLDINYNASALKITNCNIDKKGFTGNYYVHPNDLSLILISDSTDVLLNANESIFSIEFEVLKNTTTNFAMRLSDAMTRSIGYDMSGIPRNICLNDISSKVDDTESGPAFFIYPNPAFHDVKIYITDAYLNSKVCVFDNLGKCVYSGPASKELEISESYFKTSGMYFFVLQGKDRIISEKIFYDVNK